MSLLKLEKNFVGSGEVMGFIFTQVAENEKGYMYKVKHNGTIHYEVFKKETSSICLDFIEVYPKTKEFGCSAWSFGSEKIAKEKLNQLINL